MNQPELGKKILELRLSKGLTQNELAEMCSVSLRTIQRIELNEVTPRSYTLKVIFAALDFDYYNLNGNSTDVKTSASSGFWKDIFNLKKDTMKKLSVASVLVVLGFVLFFKNETQAQTIDGWIKRGDKPKSYEIGLDKTVSPMGKKCAYIKSIDSEIKGFGNLMQVCQAKLYLGKRIKMTGYIKTVNVKNWAGMWLRVDGVNDKGETTMLGFDNMYKRGLKGNTDWTKCEIVLNVPNESKTLNFGVLLDGTGIVYFDRLSFEVVKDIEETSISGLPDKPTNIDFED
ncbi:MULTISPECIES: helix-turn-helix domain-containing protein [Flavobacterium]|uniref:HTH cro/C1-type domain-containing protein n=1 Tax=Flavobacterium hankyongi TaxID=1176532 RepID=A0ABP9A2H2_9FLAO|nr:helix-turn-helix transcriptional regulator [Flavobacterium sp. N1846]